MNSVATAPTHKLPSLDWLAFGLAVACTALGSLVHQLNILVPIAVFLPSVLREANLIPESDEFTIRVMHRAGFHALLATATLAFTCYAFARPIDPPLSPQLLTGETLRKAIMYPFVVSYLLQYWGAREGAFRLLCGMALWTATTLVPMVARPEGFAPGLTGITTVIALSLVLVAVAFISRRWPRVGGGLLLIGVVAIIGNALSMLDDGQLSQLSHWAVPAMILQAVVVPGAIGLSLLASRNEG